MSSVAMSPYPTPLPILLSTALGTVLCSASANTLNQIQEVPFDAQMARTRNRPLVQRAITPIHAVGFALFTGITGPPLLWTMVNPTTACLGLANIVLYSGVYTWMKRRSIANTWVGSVVGAIPPLMGWTACGGHILPTSTSISLFWPTFVSDSGSLPLDLSLIDNPLSALALFTLLFSWQFPHFNSLSYIVRESYAQANYRMLAVFSPTQNALVSFRHSIILATVCSVLIPISGLTTWMFSLTSFLPNVILVRAAYKFWKHGGEKEARSLWKNSLWYLPAVLGLMMFHKQGMDWMTWFGLSKEEGNSKIVAVSARNE
jgi:protoheme IX farnesyltransferase